MGSSSSFQLELSSTVDKQCADLDQTAPLEQSDLGLHCMLREHCYNSLSNYSMICCSKSSAVSSALFSFTREDNGTAWNSLEVNSFCS